MSKFYLLALGLLAFGTTDAQTAPGGVTTGLSLWLKADASSTLSSTDSLNTWTYANNSSNQFSAVAGQRPIVVDSVINFLPGVFFNGAQIMDGPTEGGAPLPVGAQAYSVFAVWVPSSTASPERVWSQFGFTQGQNNGVSLWLYNNAGSTEYGDQAEIPPSYLTGMGLPYSVGTPYVSEMNLLSQDNNDLELTDQTNFATGPLVLSTSPGNATTVRFVSADYNRLGARTNPADEVFTGNLAELIVYTNPTSAGSNKNQIFSYLSLKYGIPLGTNLVASDGSTIWDATANATYNHQVFGLGLDNTSGLLVTASNSSASGSGHGSGQTASGNVVLSHPSSLITDRNFLTVGNDNGSLTESTTGAPTTPSGLSILGRNWKVSHVGNVGTVDVSIDYTGIATAGSLPDTSEFRMLVDPTGAANYTGTPTIYTPSGVSGNVIKYSAVTLNNGATFTFASSPTSLPVNWVSFTGNVSNNNDIGLSWTVANNAQAQTYTVQHSTDGVSFTSVGKVANDATVTTYHFDYPGAAAGANYFRILETDYGGASIYSKTITLNVKAADLSIRVMSNPIQTNGVALEVTAINQVNADFQLWTMGGVKVADLQQTITPGVSTVNLPTSELPAGSYILKALAGDTRLTQTIIKL
jgi:hypothetical protein